jgi:hypothetical protein
MTGDRQSEEPAGLVFTNSDFGHCLPLTLPQEHIKFYCKTPTGKLAQKS